MKKLKPFLLVIFGTFVLSSCASIVQPHIYDNSYQNPDFSHPLNLSKPDLQNPKTEPVPSKPSESKSQNLTPPNFITPPLVNPKIMLDPSKQPEFNENLKKSEHKISDLPIVIKETAGPGITAIDPRTCNDGDLCYFRYINNRSFNISAEIYAQDKDGFNKVIVKYGTGWFVDREVGTNNFYIATNIHVASLADKTIIAYDKPSPNPSLLKLFLVPQKLDEKLLNNNQKLLNVNHKVEIKNLTNLNHTDPNNRILTKVQFNNVLKNQKSYLFALVPKERLNNNFLKQLTYFISDSANEIDQIFNNSKVLFSANDIAKLGYNKSILENKFFNTNLKQSDLILNQVEIEHFFNTQDLKNVINIPTFNHQNGYIDNATLKMNISDDFLKKHYPLFLNPKKYNQWTFPKLATDNLWNFKNPPTRDLNTQPTTYIGGYPYEKLINPKTQKITHSPVFRVSKGKITDLRINFNSLELDNFKCHKDDLNFCAPNMVPKAGYDLILNSEYPTGPGSSGSMVIDQNYNTVGILWGVQELRSEFENQVLDFKPKNIISPLFSDNDQQINDPLTFIYVDNFNSNAQDVYYLALKNAITKNYIKRKAIQIVNDYNQLVNKNNKDLRFNEPTNLIEDVIKFVNKSQKTEITLNKSSNLSDDAKIVAVINALKTISEQNDSKMRINLLFLKIKPVLDNYFKFYLGINQYKSNSKYGIINYKKQLSDHFREQNIKTYYLNP